MRVQLNSIPKTRIHFGEMDDGGEISWKEKEINNLNFSTTFEERRLDYMYSEGDLSPRKYRKAIKNLNTFYKVRRECLSNNFDSNGKWIAKVVKEETFGEKLYTLYRYLRLNSRKLIKK